MSSLQEHRKELLDESVGYKVEMNEKHPRVLQLGLNKTSPHNVS